MEQASPHVGKSPDICHMFANCGPRVASYNPDDVSLPKYQCFVCEQKFFGKKAVAMMVCEPGTERPQ
eukprot:9394859-Prorocentrum_lima.AAC.1